jgi:hypothetical protein
MFMFLKYTKQISKKEIYKANDQMSIIHLIYIDDVNGFCTSEESSSPKQVFALLPENRYKKQNSR